MTETTGEGVIAYLCCQDGKAEIAFCERVFGAERGLYLEMPSGSLAHAEITLCGGKMMISDEWRDMGILGPLSLGGSPVSLSVMVPDVDATLAEAVAAGAEVLNPAEDQFHGHRMAKFRDPQGHIWAVLTEIEKMSDEEMERRFKAAFGAA